ncbi:gliding motility lipoprotein GldH [Lacihabitans lacunae]|uniref:Gliding motility lipoprotein GldH n=1 Tax=Lacihabitans lacunae TaxID=1028214 RepID=A0ABV7Z014_9BACT
MKKVVLWFVVAISTIACESNPGFKEIRDFKKSEWKIAHKQTFEFEIKDIQKTYAFNYLIRTSVSYPFFNLYLNEALTGPDGKQVSTSMDEVILFNEKTGKPYGDGLGDIYDNRVPMPKLVKYKFDKPGKYKLSIGHNMRPDPLTGIMSIGLEIVEAK